MAEMSTFGDRRTALADAVIRIASTRGLEQASVREVANEAGVAIGTVQHYFSTKDEMLSFAFTRIVDRTMERVTAVEPEPDVRVRLSRILRELLPLDDVRRAEATVYLAFSARAATSPALAEVQAETLKQIRGGFTKIFSDAGAPDPETDALLVLGMVDGLGLGAVSAPGETDKRALEKALETYLDRRFPTNQP
ncbi:TetR/AcrR family transcriptional regulator [Amycolatopsis sp. cg5]|uniref:TetR/AcrR family transcriptional regulator n=1 Tax=Amycolatopsis sp. cg5 TaxID=3238802 RepID=UPI0035267515